MSAIDYTKAYITHDNGKRLATIDENNTFVDLGAFVDDNGDVLTWPELVYGLAFGKDGEIYLTQQNGGSNEDLGGGIDTQIWKANLPAVDGKITLTKIGTGLGLHRNIAIDTHAMDIGPDGSMYILDLSGNIFTVDLSTGLASFVAKTVVDGATEDAPISNAMDIVFDANFTLYAEGTHPSGGSRLFRVNTSTGAATSVGTFSENMIMGLWANSEDTIYATKYSNPGNLYTVNPANAALTLVGNAGDYGNRPHGGDRWIAYGGWTRTDTPTLTSASYDASTGALTITGTSLPANAGATNDIDVSKLTLTGEGGNTYTLTSDEVELTSSTEFSLTLNAADQLQLAGLFNKNGTSSGGGTSYNIAAADDWAPGADSSTNIADLTGNSITVVNARTATSTSSPNPSSSPNPELSTAADPAENSTGSETPANNPVLSIVVPEEFSGGYDEITGIQSNPNLGGSLGRLYIATFGRFPDLDGLLSWFELLNNGIMTINNVCQQFITSEEFQFRYGSEVTNETFINNVYINTLGRPADAEGFSYWTYLMNKQNVQRPEIILGFADSDEHVALFDILIS